MGSRGGFTLTEIMVVIIVIATLSEVAMPMLDGFAENGRKTAVRAQMDAIKKGLIRLKADVGQYPHAGNVTKDISNYDWSKHATTLGITDDTNILSTYTCQANSFWGMLPKTFRKRYNGPYMDSSPEEFMIDPWEGQIRFTATYQSSAGKYRNIQLWLWSAGPDGIFETGKNPDTISKETQNGNYEGDDLVLPVDRMPSQY